MRIQTVFYLNFLEIVQAIPSTITPRDSNERSLNISGTAPGNAAGPVDPTFPGFAFEERSFYFYAGAGGNPNSFSQNLIKSVADRTGASPVLRVGGTSLDNSNYDPQQSKPITYPPGEKGKNIPRNITLGPSFFDSFSNFPTAQYVFDVPLVNNSVNNTVAFAKAGSDAIKNILSIEVGNEPNNENNFPDPQVYVQKWLQYTNAISTALGISSNTPTYDALTLSTPPWGNYSVSGLLSGPLKQAIGSIKEVSIHYYQAMAGDSLQDALMNHGAVVSQLQLFQDPLSYCSSQSLPLNIAEAGSAINNGVDDNALESVLGSALWQVDFMLYAMSMGINRINMQQGLGFSFSAWRPTPYNGNPPRVFAPYYANVFAADFIGTSGNTKVTNIDLQTDSLSAYAAYEGENLARVALVNLNLWSASSKTPRPLETFELHVPSSTKSATIKHLTSKNGGTAEKENSITWDGKSWTYANNGIAEQANNSTQNVDVSGGKLKVKVPASEAVMVELA